MSVIINWFLTWWLRSGRYGWSRLRRSLCEGKYLSTALPEVSTLAEIEGCLKKITWTMDGPLHLYDSISYPETVWTKKKDDCDGFASLAAELLRRWDESSNPVLVTALLRPIRASHTVCFFTAPTGGLWVFDNDMLRSEDYQKYGEVVARISQHAQKLVCWDARNPFTLEMLEFHRL